MLYPSLCACAFLKCFLVPVNNWLTHNLSRTMVVFTAACVRVLWLHGLPYLLSRMKLLDANDIYFSQGFEKVLRVITKKTSHYLFIEVERSYIARISMKLYILYNNISRHV